MELLLWLGLLLVAMVRFRVRLPERLREPVTRGWNGVLPRLERVRQAVSANSRQRLAVLLVPWWDRAAHLLLWGGGFVWLCWLAVVFDHAGLFTPAVAVVQISRTVLDLLPQPPELALLVFLLIGGLLHMVAAGTSVLSRLCAFGGTVSALVGALIYGAARTAEPLLMMATNYLFGWPGAVGRYGVSSYDRVSAEMFGGTLIIGGVMLLLLASRLAGGGAIRIGRDGRERWNPGYFTRGVSRLLRNGDAWDAGLMRPGDLHIGRHVATALGAAEPASERMTYTGNQHMLLLGSE